MSLTKVDQSTSSIRRSSLVVNLSTTKKRSSVTTLLTSTLGSKRVARYQSSRYNNCSNPVGQYSLDSGGGGGGGGGGSSSSSSGSHSYSLHRSTNDLSSPRSAPPSLAKPSYRTAGWPVGDADGPPEDSQRPKSSIINLNRHTSPQVLSASEESRARLEDEEEADGRWSPKEARTRAGSRPESSKENSPEPIVEVKHTSSSGSCSSSEADQDCRKLVRRRTVRRYHKSEQQQPEQPASNNKSSIAELTVSINRSSGGSAQSQREPEWGQQCEESGRTDECQNEDEGVRSHFRSRPIGAYYGQAKHNQTKTSSSTSSSSSSSSSTSTSKIAKCSITTNRKSTTSHHHRLISESLLSSSSKQADNVSTSTNNTPGMASDSSQAAAGSQRPLIIRPSLGGLFDRQKAAASFLDKTSVEVKRHQEESSIHHKQSHFSSSSMGSASGGQNAAALLSGHSNLASTQISSSDSRHFKSSASLIVSSGAGCDSATAAAPFLSSEPLLSSPGARSLVKEIVTEFAELENALSSTGSHYQNQRGQSSSSLFSRRLLSPLSAGPQYPAIGAPEPLGQRSNQVRQVGFSSSEPLQHELPAADGLSYQTLSNSSELTGTVGQAPMGSSSNGDRIRQLLIKAHQHTGNANPVEPSRPNELLKVEEIESKLSSVLAKPSSHSVGEEVAQQQQQQKQCNPAMAIERIDQRMSDLCKKLEECRNTKELIDLLKAMVQIIEKAWSVPVCGDDLGFKLCSSLREAGGLDVILGFIGEAVASGDLRPITLPASAAEKPTVSAADELKALVRQSSAKAKNSSSSNPLRLNLSKLSQSSQSMGSASPTQVHSLATGEQQQQQNGGAAKDSDSDLITSDLGLDSTSVESLSYVSAAQLQTPEATKGDPPTQKAATSEAARDQNETEDELDLENEVAIESAPSDGLNEQEAADLRQEELVFLSARLLSQCLTSDNRNYIVDNGLESVIKLAQSFTTSKSGLSQRLLSCSMAAPNKQPAVASEAGNQPSKHTAGETTKQQQPEPTSKHGAEMQAEMQAVIGTEIIQHLFKHSEDTCSKMISLGALQAILYGCRSSNVETLRHCASALANLALYGGPDSQQTMIEQKAHVWLFPLAFNEDDNIQYYACLAIVVLVANQEIEADVLKSSTLDLVEPFVTSHEPRKFAESTTAHIHGQSASWLRKLIPLLESKREEARNLACFHFAMEAYIKKEQGQTQVFRDIGAVEPLEKVGSSPIAIASKFACQALRLIGEKEPHKLSQQVPLWTSEDVSEWVSQIGFERFKQAFVESRVDGDLLLQLDEEMLKTDIGIENGIIRRRFLRELSNLKRIADYSSVDKSGLGALLGSTGQQDFIQYIYPMIQLGVGKDNIHLLDSEQLLRECKIANTIHRMKLAHAIKALQERMAVEAATNESGSTDGSELKTLDVFVSYRRATGSQLASLLKVHLQLRGFSVFIDVERLEAGKFDNNLLDSIKTAKNFILVLSPNALDRCIGDQQCKDWVHKEIVAALASNCNIIPIIDNFHWPDPEQLPEDMRSITYFNGVRWIHDYQDACVDKVERFIRGEINNGSGGLSGVQLGPSAQSSLQRLPCTGTYPSTPSIVATPSIAGSLPPGPSTGYPASRSPFEGPDYHPLSFASQYLQHSQNAPPIRR